MKSAVYKIFLFVMCLGVISATAAHRPIRVLIVTFVGSSGYQHTCIKTGLPYLINELQHPGIGADSVNVSPVTSIQGYGTNPLAGRKFPLTGITPFDSGIVIDTMGNASNGAPIATAADGHRLVSKLPNYDVLIFMSTTAMGNLLSTTPEEDSLITWMDSHGTFALHATSDTHQIWKQFDTTLGATFPNTGNGHTTYFGDLLQDTTAGDSLDPNFIQLRAGLAQNVNPANAGTRYTQNYSYRFYEEWFSYLSDPRLTYAYQGWAIPQIVETFNEASLSLSGSPTSTQEADASPMVGGPGGHDHPLSWYRINSAGGRLWQQAVGHEDTLYEQNAYIRNVMYNAVVWLGGFPGGPSAGSTSPIYNNKAVYTGSELSRITSSGNSLTVTFLQPGVNVVEIRALDGRRLALVNGMGQDSHTFTNLRHNTVYAVLTSGALGHQSKLVTIQ